MKPDRLCATEPDIILARDIQHTSLDKQAGMSFIGKALIN